LLIQLRDWIRLRDNAILCSLIRRRKDECWKFFVKKRLWLFTETKKEDQIKTLKTDEVYEGTILLKNCLKKELGKE
jgi:hypothetical protein